MFRIEAIREGGTSCIWISFSVTYFEYCFLSFVVDAVILSMFKCVLTPGNVNCMADMHDGRPV